MTEAQKIDNLPEVRKPAPPVVPIKDGVFVPADLDGLWRVATVMASSGLMPKGIDRVEQVFVCVQMGLEVGLSPMQSVQNIAPINGRPAIWGDAQLGLVRGSNLLEDFHETYEGEFPKKDFKAVCIAKRKGQKTPIRSEFSIQDAMDAGLWSKSGTWKQYPKRMLQMRARSWTLRDGFGDVLKGIPQAEEIMDITLDMKPSKSGVYESTQKQEESIDTSEFKKLVSAVIDYPDSTLDKFLAVTAKANGCSVDQLMVEAVKSFDGFWKSFEAWRKKNYSETKTEPIKAEPNMSNAAFDEIARMQNLDRESYVQATSQFGRDPQIDEEVNQVCVIFDDIIDSKG